MYNVNKFNVIDARTMGENRRRQNVRYGVHATVNANKPSLWSKIARWFGA